MTIMMYVSDISSTIDRIIQKIKILKKWKRLMDILSYTQVHHKWQSYDIWFLRYQLQQTDSFVIFGHVLPLTAQKMKILWNWKKAPGDIIILHKSVSEIIIIGYTVPELCVPDVIVTFHFELFFTLSPPLTAPKMKISKNWKKHLEVSSFYTSAPKIMITGYAVPEIWCVPDVIIFHFELFFTFLTHQQPEKWKYKEIEKSTWRYHHFTLMYHKSWS